MQFAPVERKSAKVIVAMYDSNDDVIGIDWWYAKPLTIPAGSQQSFQIEVGFYVGKPNHAAPARYGVIAGGD